VGLHLPHREPPGVERQDLGIEARQPPLMLGDELGLEGAGPIARDRDRDRTVSVSKLFGERPLR